jgi:hypothetical protein
MWLLPICAFAAHCSFNAINDDTAAGQYIRCRSAAEHFGDECSLFRALQRSGRTRRCRPRSAEPVVAGSSRGARCPRVRLTVRELSAVSAMSVPPSRGPSTTSAAADREYSASQLSVRFSTVAASVNEGAAAREVFRTCSDASVGGQGCIDLARPRQRPACHINHVEAILLQKFGNLEAAPAGTTQHGNGLGAIQLTDPVADLAHGDVLHAGHAGHGQLPLLADVQQCEYLAARTAGNDFARGNFLNAHGLLATFYARPPAAFVGGSGWNDFGPAAAML